MSSNLFQVNSSAVIFNSKGEILLGKRSPDEEVFPGLWGIPGGKLDAADGSLEEGLSREVKEEVGVDITNLRLIQNNTVVKPDVNKVYLVFSADISPESPEPSPIEDTVEVRWFPFGEIKESDLTPRTYEVLKLAIKR